MVNAVYDFGFGLSSSTMTKERSCEHGRATMRRPANQLTYRAGQLS
jgi:hypothetical protein